MDLIYIRINGRDFYVRNAQQGSLCTSGPIRASFGWSWMAIVLEDEQQRITEGMNSRDPCICNHLVVAWARGIL